MRRTKTIIGTLCICGLSGIALAQGQGANQTTTAEWFNQWYDAGQQGGMQGQQMGQQGRQGQQMGRQGMQGRQMGQQGQQMGRQGMQGQQMGRQGQQGQQFQQQGQQQGQQSSARIMQVSQIRSQLQQAMQAYNQNLDETASQIVQQAAQDVHQQQRQIRDSQSQYALQRAAQQLNQLSLKLRNNQLQSTQQFRETVNHVMGLLNTVQQIQRAQLNLDFRGTDEVAVSQYREQLRRALSAYRNNNDDIAVQTLQAVLNDLQIHGQQVRSPNLQTLISRAASQTRDLAQKIMNNELQSVQQFRQTNRQILQQLTQAQDIQRAVQQGQYWQPGYGGQYAGQPGQMYRPMDRGQRGQRGLYGAQYGQGPQIGQRAGGQFGQQGQFEQPGQFGQQGQFRQQGQFGQQQYDRQGRFQQQPFGGQGRFRQQGQFGQQPQFGQGQFGQQPQYRQGRMWQDGTGMSQQQQGLMQRGQRSQRTGFQQTGGSGQAMSLRGEIVNPDTQVQGVSADSRIAEVRLDSGRSVHVDLGPQQATQNLDLREGQQIFVRGTPRQVNGQSIFMANEVARLQNATPIQRGGQQMYDQQSGGQRAGWQQQGGATGGQQQRR